MSKIDAIELYLVHMPLIEPWTTAYGRDDDIFSVLLSMTSGDVTGWGEACPLGPPCYSPESSYGLFDMLGRWLIPCAIGQTITDGHDLQQCIGHFKGNPFAKSALDTAWWDLHARQQGKPLWQVIGGKSPTVKPGEDFGVIISIDTLIKRIANARQQGFSRVKLKYRPGWDLPMIDAVRNAFPDMTLHIDCNSGYSLDDLSMFQRLDQYNLAMIEQPLGYDDLIDHAQLQRLIKTPICLDESINSVSKARKAIKIGACQWVNIKQGRVGGLTAALEIHDLCQQANIGCWVGSMLESGVGASCAAALATLPNMKYPSDIISADKFYRQDLADFPILFTGRSEFLLSDRPGLGCQPDPARLAKQTIQHQQFIR